MDILVRRTRSRRASNCPSAGEAAIQTPAVHDASVLALGTGREPVPAKAAGPADPAASLCNHCPDCDALCQAAVAHPAQAVADQVSLLSWPGQFDVDVVHRWRRQLFRQAERFGR